MIFNRNYNSGFKIEPFSKISLNAIYLGSKPEITLNSKHSPSHSLYHSTFFLSKPLSGLSLLPSLISSNYRFPADDLLKPRKPSQLASHRPFNSHATSQPCDSLSSAKLSFCHSPNPRCDRSEANIHLCLRSLDLLVTYLKSGMTLPV